MEKALACASCSAELEPRSGPGRPSVYCSEGCRRFAEFRIRGIVRRIDRYEVELREVKTGTGYFDDDERRARLRALRRWIRNDTAQLRALLGGNIQARNDDDRST